LPGQTSKTWKIRTRKFHNTSR